MAKSIFDIPLFNDGIISSDKEDKVKKFRGEDNEIPLSVPAYDLASYVYSGNTSTYNITLPRIATILNQAKTGDAREQSQLFKMLQDKDPIISAHLQTRKQAVQSVEWNITGGESDYKRSEVTKILQDAGIDELIKHLSDAVAIGYSGAGIQWKMGGGDIDGFTFINSDNWIFNEYGDVGLTNYQGSDIVISDKSSPWNDIFIFHKYMLRPGIASEGGLLRNLAQYSFFKSEAVGNFARFLEKYGMPLLSTTIPKSDFQDSATKNKVKNALKNFGSDGAIVLAEGSQVANIAGSSATNAPIFTAFIGEMNKNITLAILGQEATSGVAGGLSKGGAQENVRLDLLSGDCKALSETINRQLVSHLEYNKWASKELKFVMNYEPAEDIKTLAEKINAAKSLGFDPPKDWVEEKFKMPLNDAKETFSLGAMPTPAPTAESTPAIPAISVQEPTASTPTPVAPVATPEAELTTSAGTELTGLNSLRAFADLNTEYASEYNRIIDSANVSEDIKNELRAIAPSNSDMIYSVISSKLLDESTTDEERTSLANLRSALSSINVEAIQRRLELDKKRESEIQKAIEESSKIDIQIPKDFLRWKDEEQLAYLNAERKKLESMPDSEQKKNILDELNQLESQEIGTATQTEQLEVAPVEPSVIKTPDSERRDAVASEIVSDNANAETKEELPESVYIPSVAEEFRKSTMLEEYKNVVVETGDEDKWKEMFEDKYGVTPDNLEVYTFEDAIDYDNKAMAQIQNEQVEQRIPEQQELIANINLKTEGMPYDVRATVYEKVSKYGTNIDLAIEQAQQEYTLKSQAGLVATDAPDIKMQMRYGGAGVKGSGYYGAIQRPDGNVSSEIGIHVEVDGREMEIPTLVPGLTVEQFNYLINTPIDKIFTDNPELFKSIQNHAVNFAMNRINSNPNIPYQEAVWSSKEEEGKYTIPSIQSENANKELNSKLQEAITLSTLGKHNNEEYARKYFDKAIESISDEATKRVAIANKESLWNSFSRARELMVFQRLQAERSTINFDGAFEELNGSPSGTSNSIIKNTMDELLRLPAKTYEAMNRGAEGLIGDFASFSSMFIPNEEFEKWNQNLRAYKNIEEEKFTIEGEENILGSAWYGIAKMAPQIMATIAVSAATGGLGGVVAGGAMTAEGLATVATAAKASSTAAAIFSYMQGAGSAYGSMIDIGIDKRIALGASLVAGIPYAALEKFQLGKAKFITRAGKELGIDALIPAIAKEVMEKNLSNAGVKTFNELLIKKIENKFKNYAKVLGSKGISYAIDTIEEGVAEGLQDVTMEISEDYAKAINDYVNKTAMAGDVGYKNWMNTFKNTFIQTLPTMAAMQGVGSVNQASLSRFLKYVKDKKALNNNKANIKTISLEDVDANTKDYLLKNMKFALENPEYVSKSKTKQDMPFDSLNENLNLREFLSIFRNANDAVAKGKVLVEFKSAKDMKEDSARALIQETKDEGDGKVKISIEINKDKITTPEQFIGIMGHEDFVHRFLYGKNSPLSIKEMNKLESIVESFIDKNKSIFPNEAEYRTLYKKQGNTDARINQLIREEKISAYMEKGGFLELIDKESGNIKKEFEPSDIKKNIRDFLIKISGWFRANMPSVFGNSKDIDILNALSAAYNTYRYDSPSAKATAEMLKREIINDAKNATVETIIGQSDIDSLDGLLNGLSEVVNKTDIVKDKGDVESINNLISEMNKESDKRMAIIKYNDELNLLLKNPHLENAEQIKTLKSDIENLKAKNPSINKVLGIKSTRKQTISFAQWMSDREYSSKMGYKAGIVAEKAEAGKRVSYSKMASDYVNSLNITKKTKDQLKKDIKAVSITQTLTSYINAVDSLMSRAYEKEIIAEYKQMAIDMLAQVPLNIKSEAVNKIESLASRILDSREFSEKSNKIVKIALSKSQGAKDIAGVGVGDMFSMTPVQYFKDKFRTERKGERKALKAVKLIGADIKSYLNEISASEQIKNKIISGLWGDSVSIENLDLESRETTLEDLKSKVDALVVEDEKNKAIDKLKSSLRKLKEAGGTKKLTPALQSAYDENVGKVLEKFELNPKKMSEATKKSMEASLNWANNPEGDLPSLLTELQGKREFASDKSSVEDVISDADKIYKQYYLYGKPIKDLNTDEVNNIITSIKKSIINIRMNILKNKFGDIDRIIEFIRNPNQDISSLNIEDIQNLSGVVESILSQNEMIKNKKATQKALEIERDARGLEAQLMSSENIKDIISQYDKATASITEETTPETISEITKKFMRESFIPDSVRDKMINYINKEGWKLESSVGGYESGKSISNAISDRLEVEMQNASIAPTTIRKIFKAISDKFKHIVPYQVTKAGRVQLEVLCWELDGRKDTGLWHDKILKPLYDAENKETSVVKRFAETMQTTEEVYGFSGRDFNNKQTKLNFKVKPNKLGATEKTVELLISKNQVVALYLQLLNNDNRTYLENVGFVLPDDESKSPYRLDELAIREIMAIMEESDELQAMAKAIQRVFKQNANFINEVSERMLGYDIATVPNYYMITTKNSLQQAFMKAEDRAYGSDVNISKFVAETAPVTAAKILKERKGMADMPILLYGATEVAEKHTNMTAKYYGFAEPLERINGIISQPMSIATTNTIIDEVENKYGYGISESIKSMPYSIERIMTNDEIDRMTEKLSGLIAKGLLSWRSTTIAVQSLGLMTVLNEISPKYWTKSARLLAMPSYTLSKDEKTERENLISELPSFEYIKERSMLAYKRYELGGFGILPALISRHGSLTKLIRSDKTAIVNITSALDTVGDTGMNLIGQADKMVIRAIWHMVELEQKDKFGEIESEAAQDAIVKRFEEVVRNTQGSSNIVEKSGMQRSHSFLARMATYLQAQNVKESAYLYKALIAQDWKRIGKTSAVTASTMASEIALRGLIGYLAYQGSSAFWSAIGVEKEDKDPEELFKTLLSRAVSDRFGLTGQGIVLINSVINDISNRKIEEIDKIQMPGLRPIVSFIRAGVDFYRAGQKWDSISNGGTSSVSYGYNEANKHMAKGMMYLLEAFGQATGTGINNIFDAMAMLGNADLIKNSLSELSIGFSSEEKQKELAEQLNKISELEGKNKMTNEELKEKNPELYKQIEGIMDLNDSHSLEALVLADETPEEQPINNTENVSEQKIVEEKKDTPDASGIVQRLGRKIFEMKQSRDAINQKLEELKAQIIQYLTGEPVEIAGLGKIFKVVGGVVQVANKEKLKEVLVQILKLKPEQADMIISKSTTPKEIAEYLKIQSTKVK